MSGDGRRNFRPIHRAEIATGQASAISREQGQGYPGNPA
jgi:hypothetical protein